MNVSNQYVAHFKLTIILCSLYLKKKQQNKQTNKKPTEKKTTRNSIFYRGTEHRNMIKEETHDIWCVVMRFYFLSWVGAIVLSFILSVYIKYFI